MKSFKSIFIITGLFLLFVGNVGVNVFKHICEEDGVWTSFFVKTVENHCDSEDDFTNHVKSCCPSEKEKEDNDCCKDQTEFFKINLDFYNDPSIVIPATLAVVNTFSFDFILNETQKDYYTSKYVNPPPKKAGKDILIQHQVFLI